MTFNMEDKPDWYEPLEDVILDFVSDNDVTDEELAIFAFFLFCQVVESSNISEEEFNRMVDIARQYVDEEECRCGVCDKCLR